VSADEIKKTADVEAAAEPEKTEAEAAEKTEAEAIKKKPAAKKPAARKPAAAEADATAADAKGPAKKPAAKKPAAKAAKAETADEDAAKPAAKKPAAKTRLRKAAPAAEKPAPKAERQPKPAAAAKTAAEARKGAAGVATFVDAAGKEVETRKLADGRFAVAADVNTLHLVVRAEQAARLPQAQWASRLEDVPEAPAFLVANEFLDALPVRQYLATERGWREKRVGLAEGRLAWGLSAPLPGTGAAPEAIGAA